LDIKPHNVLVNHIDGPTRFSGVKLADFGDAVQLDPDRNAEGHEIGAVGFRSPEAFLRLRWGIATDIWSFGTTVSTCTPELMQCAIYSDLVHNFSLCFGEIIGAFLNLLQTQKTGIFLWKS
jgi:serine/threonine protein kinase